MYIANLKFIASPSLFPVSNIPSHDYKATVHLRTKLRIPITGRSEDQKVLNKTAISIFITYRTLCYATEAAIDALLDV